MSYTREEMAATEDNMTLSNISMEERAYMDPNNCWGGNAAPSCFDPWKEVNFICIGMIMPIGFIFNTLALLVFNCSWLRSTVPGRYFMALAIADNLVLIGEFLNWLNAKTSAHESRTGVDFMHKIDFMCRTVHWLRHGARMWSSWVTVGITFERFLTVTYPLQMASHNNPRKSTVIVSILFVLCFSASSYTLDTLHTSPFLGQPLCQVSQPAKYHLLNFIFVTLVGELVIPSIIVLIFTILIIRKLAKVSRQRKYFTQGQHSLNNMNAPRQRERQPTIALLAIAIMFLTVRLPYMITFIMLNSKGVISLKIPVYPSYIAYKIAHVLAVTNYAFNFLLFCISGVTFRTVLHRFLICRCAYQRPLLADFTRSRSLSVERMNHFHVVVGNGRSASVDILCQIGRKFTPNASNHASVEHLQNPLLRSIRSVSVGAEKQLNCNSSLDIKMNGLRRQDLLKRSSEAVRGPGLKKNMKTRSLTPEKMGMNGSITFIDESE